MKNFNDQLLKNVENHFTKTNRLFSWADKLLSRILPEDKALAGCYWVLHDCTACGAVQCLPSENGKLCIKSLFCYGGGSGGPYNSHVVNVCC